MGILQARILEWVAILFSSEPHFVRIIHYDLVQETLIQFLGWEDPLEKG